MSNGSLIILFEVHVLQEISCIDAYTTHYFSVYVSNLLQKPCDMKYALWFIRRSGSLH